MAAKPVAIFTTVMLICILIFLIYEIEKGSSSSGISKKENDVSDILKLAAKERRTSFDPVINNYNRIVEAETQEHIFNCTNIHHITISGRLDAGKSKQGFLGEYNGNKVVVKMTTNDQIEVKECMEKVGGKKAEVMLRKRCHGYPHMKMFKEILLHHELMHPSMARLLGYCVRSEELDSLDLSEHGVISVYEYGENFTEANLTSSSWTERLRYVVGIAALIRYLESSPLGSVRYTDFRLSHARLFGRDLRVIDISSFVNSDYHCDLNEQCPYGIICKKGICPGYNAKYNMDMFYKHFFACIIMKGLIPDSKRTRVERLAGSIKNLKIDGEELVKSLLELV